MALKTNFKDALPNGVLKYRLVQNEDGTVSFVDVTEYAQIGDRFGAKEVNEIARVINGIPESICDVYDPTRTYAKGDHCIYDSVLYECNTAITTAEEWTAGHWTGIKIIDVLDKQNDNISNLQTKMTSFENTKSEIVGSGLGQALKLTAASTWAAIVAALKGVVNRGAWNGTIGSSGGSVTIPAGCHNGSGKVTGPTLAGLVGSNVTLASAANLLSGVTAYGKNGTKYTGTNKGYDAGYSAGVTAKTSQWKSGTFTMPSSTGNATVQTITVGFQPNVFLAVAQGNTKQACAWTSLASGINVFSGTNGYGLLNCIAATSTGITITGEMSYGEGKTFNYVAARIV